MFHNVAVTDDQSIKKAFKKKLAVQADSQPNGVKPKNEWAQIKKWCKMARDVKATRRKTRAKCPQFLRMFTSAYATRNTEVWPI
jgi:hypothetical protein